MTLRNIVIILILFIIFGSSLFILNTRKSTEQNGTNKITSLKIDIETKNMKLTSSAFGNNQSIPPKYTCDGENIHPPLTISGVPKNSKSLALIIDDPDAPLGVWTHWVVWNIDPTTKEIAENSIPNGAIEGKTSFGKPGYGGPCPPSGTHHYRFKLYALDITLSLPQTATTAELENAMTGHILQEAELVGLYSRK